MRRRIRNVIQIEIDGATLEGASDLEFYVKQDHGVCRTYTPSISDATHIEVEIPLADAMQLQPTTASIQLAYTNLNGYPVATDILCVSVGELLKDDGYGN